MHVPGAHLSVGPAATTHEGLIDCGPRSRPSAVGVATAEDGTQWTVPAATHFTAGPKAVDLYNECGTSGGTTLEDLDLAAVPVVDAGGEETFVAYVFADNYFELYANGTLVGVDAVPFTPFNSSVLRFKATRPVTLAVQLVDWEENLGLGSEAGRGTPFHPGDGGLVMLVQDAAGQTVLTTDERWKAQTFYTSPLIDPSCVKLEGHVRDSSACSTSDSDDASGYSALFWDLPEDWTSPSFDDSDWPQATTYTNDTVGVDNKPAYTNFTQLFDAPGADAQFIWSSNLVLDNLVLTRATIR